MKKKFLISMIICSAVLILVGCGSKQSSQENTTTETTQDSGTTHDTSENKTDKSSSADSSNVKTADTTNINTSNKKEYYLKMLDDIQKKIDKDYDMQKAGTTYEMRNVNGEQYDLWDGALNTIYKDLKNTLSPSDMKKLQDEELAWIYKKESDAKKESMKVQGGTLEQVYYGVSIVESTKKRCYELVIKYMGE